MRPLLRLALPLVTVLLAVPLAAQTIWTDGVTGDWSTAANWSTGLPSASKAFQINNGATQLSTAAGVTPPFGWIAPTAGQNGALTITGAGALTTPTFYGGYAGTGTLTVSSGGTFTSPTAYLGYNAGANGQVTVSGTGSRWTVATTFQIGRSGSSSLTVASGGTVTGATATLGVNAGANGNATITGAGSTWAHTQALLIGSLGHGTLVVADGGTVTNASAYIALGSSSVSTVIVNGAGSNWTGSGTLDIGYVGNGTLTISAGGRVNNTRGTIANTAGSVGQVFVTGTGSTWTNSTAVDVARTGTGTLTIESGGVVSAPYVVLSGEGHGTLNLNAGGRLEVGNGGLFKSPNTGTATLNLAGGTLRATANFETSLPATLTQTSQVDSNGFFLALSGVLDGTGGLEKAGAGWLTLTASNTYSGATIVSAGTLRLSGSAVHSAFSVNAGGVLIGTGASGPLTINAGGTFAPGNYTGLFTIHGDLSLLGTTALELGGAGTRGVAYDAITATGTISFGGALNVMTLGGAVLASGARFDLFDWTGAASGTFSSLTLPALIDGLSWDVSHLYTDGSLIVVTTPIPEPSTYVTLAGTAALALAAWRNRRSNRNRRTA